MEREREAGRQGSSRSLGARTRAGGDARVLASRRAAPSTRRAAHRAPVGATPCSLSPGALECPATASILLSLLFLRPTGREPLCRDARDCKARHADHAHQSAVRPDVAGARLARRSYTMSASPCVRRTETTRRRPGGVACCVRLSRSPRWALQGSCAVAARAGVHVGEGD